jgi:hypothetical protein
MVTGDARSRERWMLAGLVVSVWPTVNGSANEKPAKQATVEACRRETMDVCTGQGANDG